MPLVGGILRMITGEYDYSQPFIDRCGRGLVYHAHANTVIPKLIQMAKDDDLDDLNGFVAYQMLNSYAYYRFAYRSDGFKADMSTVTADLPTYFFEKNETM